MPGLWTSPRVGSTRWHHIRPSALLVAGLVFLMFVLFAVVLMLALSASFR